METEKGRTRSHSVENWFWKRLLTSAKIQYSVINARLTIIIYNCTIFSKLPPNIIHNGRVQNCIMNLEKACNS